MSSWFARGLERREFMAWAAAAGASVALLGCGGEGAAGTVVAAGGKVTLSFSQFPDLSTPGGGVVVQVQGGNPVLVVRQDTTTAVAMSAVCTHQGCTVNFDQGTKGASCPCHGSQYDAAGQVVHGPATRSLAALPAVVDGAGITVTVG